MRIRHIALAMGVAAIAAGLVLGTAVGHNKGGPTPKTWTTVFKSPIAIEGLTLDHRGNLYVPQRGGAAGCSIVKISSTGGADQTGVVVARMDPPCNPAGLAFGPDGRLYLTGFGAAGDEIGVVTPSDGTGTPPVATGFATGTPGANGLAFDKRGTCTCPTAGRPRAACSGSGRLEAQRRCSSASSRCGTPPASDARTSRSSRVHRPARRTSSRTGSRSTRTATCSSPTRRAARCGRSSSDGAEPCTRRPGATRPSRPTRSAWTRSSSSIRRSTARTASRSTATATSMSTRTSGTRSSSSTAAAT